MGSDLARFVFEAYQIACILIGLFFLALIIYVHST